ncbi:hypothetical protein CLU79DRAFT_187766 [Phycomyces nitens]|nr:hypothetical protein CLU79DRAFT_187766 [Phycomyces nitens]
MPGPATLFTLGAVGVAGATMYARRNSAPEQTSAVDKDTWEGQISPHVMARRGSRGTSNDLWDSNKQAEHHWRRDYGINFGHNSHAKFPFNHSQK